MGLVKRSVSLLRSDIFPAPEAPITASIYLERSHPDRQCTIVFSLGVTFPSLLFVFSNFQYEITPYQLLWICGKSRWDPVRFKIVLELWVHGDFCPSYWFAPTPFSILFPEMNSVNDGVAWRMCNERDVASTMALCEVSTNARDN